jgi:hypothetical protein
VGSAVLWIPVNTLNFLFVPAAFRILPGILTTFFWNVFLSYQAYAKPMLMTLGDDASK